MSTTIYTKVSAGVAKHIKGAVQAKQLETIDISRGLDYAVLSEPALIYWEGTPSKESGEGKLLRMLHSLAHVEIVVGDAKRIVRHALGRFSPEKLAPKKSAPSDSAPSDTTSSTVLLIAPDGPYEKIREHIEKRHFEFATIPVPMGADKETQSRFRHKIRDAMDVLVYVPEADGKLYERIITILPDMLGCEVERVDTHTWQAVLNEKYGPIEKETPTVDADTSPADDDNTPSTEEQSSIDNDVEVMISRYRDQLRTYSLFNVQRELCEPMIEKDSSEETLIIGQRRWERMALSYRRSAAEFKPWPVKPPPADMANVTSWEKLQYITKEQSELCESILALRESIVNAIAADTKITDEAQQWHGANDEARDYFAKLEFKALLKKGISAGDLPKEDSDSDQNEKSGMFQSKEDKALAEAELALEAFMGVEERAWKGVVAGEIEGLEQDIIVRFWNFYRAVAVNWARSDKPEDYKSDSQRLFLRTAYIGATFGGIQQDKTHHLDYLLSQDDIEPTFKDGSTNAVYFDQFLELLCQNLVAPSYDENLELNDRGGEEWKAARQLRKVATLKRMRAIYSAKKELLESRQDSLRAEFEELQASAEQAKEKKAKRELADAAHDAKIAISRSRDHLTQIEEELGKIRDDDLKSPFDETYPLEHWVKKEVDNLRAKIRLMNRLKERHLPTVLAENLANFSPEKQTTPQRMKDIMGNVLSHDISCCDLHLIPHKKRQYALIASIPPLIIIAPGNGQMGFSMEPADDSSEGRIIMPSKVVATINLRATFIVCLSDYRWDSCMVQAGADWVTSDYFVAAYARVRWDYRNKNKEVREKAWIDKEDADRKNFRRHYALLEESMDEGGKKLYYKSKPMYENLIKYFPLPPGVDKIRS